MDSLQPGISQFFRQWLSRVHAFFVFGGMKIVGIQEPGMNCLGERFSNHGFSAARGTNQGNNEATICRAIRQFNHLHHFRGIGRDPGQLSYFIIPQLGMRALASD